MTINRRQEKEAIKEKLASPAKKSTASPHNALFEENGDPETEAVKALAFYGNSLNEIATYINQNPDYVRHHYEALIESARISANTEVAQSVYEQARTGDFRAQKFWLESMAERFTPSVNVDHTSSDGSMGNKQQTTILLAVKQKFKDVTHEPEYKDYQLIEQEEEASLASNSQPENEEQDLIDELLQSGDKL